MGEAKRRNKKPSPLRGKGKFILYLIVACIIVAAGYDFFRRSRNSLLTHIVPARTTGAQDAPLKIVEFFDLQDLESARGARIIDNLMQKHPGEILLSKRHYPSDEYNAVIGSVFAECAARQDRFWNYHDELIVKQNIWRQVPEVKPLLAALADPEEIDVEELKACAETEEAREAVEADKRLGDAYFVKSVPTYFINENKFIGVEEMEQYLNEYFENKRLGLN